MYIAMIFYLTTPTFQWYFHKIFRYGKYALYTRTVSLKSGLQIPIYFFSKNEPKSGHPTTLPNGYMIEENQYSHMPYLKKKNGSLSKHDLKQSNTHDHIPVYYVVNNSQTTSTRYPWIIRSQRTILSNHRTKNAAVRKARVLAFQKKGRVLVQKTNGKFGYGFTPRSMKKQ
jgi:hypothetical protein